ncbi:MAG TPA: hypothetical protein VN258_04090 [Mobilitalea sp.]|nr:hypothetical protein [Mobilitalea sp.]
MPKQTKLDEQAAIYQPRKKQTEKEKLKDMPFKDKLTYLYEYYRIHAIVAIAVIALILYFIHQIRTPDIKPSFYAAIVNSAVDQTKLQNYATEFSDYLQLDPKRNSVELNDTFYITNDSMSSMQQVLTTYMAAAEVDVIIAPESTFKEYAYYSYFAKLSDELPTDVYSELTNYFYISGTEEDSQKNAYGIYLADTDLFNGVTYNSEPYVLGIIPNYPHQDNTIDFIRYLFKNLEK